MSNLSGEAAEVLINIQGEKVVLGPLRRELLPLYQRWVNDFEVVRTLGAIPMRPLSFEQEESWYHGTIGDARETSFTIYERATMRPIGTTGLREINHQHGTATWGILIGEKDCWNKGYGTETARLMLDYAFTALSLTNVLLTVYSYNTRGIRAYLRAGYKEIGRRRGARRFAGGVYDEVYMDCIASEFESLVLRSLLAP